MSAKQHPNPDLIVQTMPGLAQIAWRELRAQGHSVSHPTYLHVPGRNSLLLFNHDGDAAELMRLRCAEDIFAVVLSTQVGGGPRGLDLICERVAASVGRLHQALELHDRLKGHRSRRRGDPIRFRLITRLSGSQHTFPRQTMRRHVEAAIQLATRRSWIAVAEEGEDVEIWCTVCDQDVVVAVRLSEADMRQRDYKSAHLPASLRPSVAAALALLSQPQDDDNVLDPMCGAGTVLIERAMMGRYQQLVGVDISPEAIEAATQNFGPRHKPRQMLRADARRLPLQDASVNRILCNLPFGKQIARPEDLPKLYRSAWREFDRVLQSGGRCVLMTSAAGLLRRLAGNHSRFYLVEAHKIQVLGQRAEITVWGAA